MAEALIENFSTLRENLLNDTLLWMSIGGTPSVAMSIFLAFIVGWQPFYFLLTFLLISIWLLYFFRKQISHAIKAYSLLFILWATCTGGLLRLGPQALSGLFAVIFGFVALLFLSERYAWVLIFINTISISIIGIAATNHWINFNLDYQKFAHSPIIWANVVWLLSVFTVILSLLCYKIIYRIIDRDNATRKMVDYIKNISLNTPGVIYQLKIDPAGKISFPFINENLLTIFGFDADSVMADANVALQSIHPDDKQKLRLAVQLSAKTLTAFSESFRIQLPQRGTVWVEQRLSAPEQLPDHSILWHGLLCDITKIKVLEQRLLATVEKASNVAVQWYNQEGEVVYWNHASELLYGIAATDAVGKTLALLNQTPQQCREYYKNMEVIRCGAVTIGPFESKVNNTDGTVRIVSSTLFEIPGDFSPLYACMMIDITEQQKAKLALIEAREIAESASKAKTEFLTSMSHELRTPLNAIIGFAQMLEMEVTGPLLYRQKEAISHLRNGGQHLLELISEILDLARIESNQLDLASKPLSLLSLIDEALLFIQPLSLKNSISIIKCSSNDIYVQVDHVRIRQILLNLLSNAVKYNKKNGKVYVSWGKKWDMARITISDTGQGIPLGKYNEVFRPFNRFGAETKNIEGTGVGLVICKKLVEAMGGQIGFESADGCGCDFWIEVPLAAAPPALEKPAASSIADEPPQREWAQIEGNVIYIEDGPANINVMRHVFDMLPKVDLQVALDGRSGLTMIQHHIPDLVLMDIHLPDISGFAVLEEMKSNLVTAHIPAIAVSASAMREQVAAGLAAGFREYMTKPLDIKRLLNLIHDVLLQEQKQNH